MLSTMFAAVKDKVRSSVKEKLRLIHVAFAGRSYDASQGAFQDLHSLIELRNALVHSVPSSGEIANGQPVSVSDRPEACKSLPPRLLKPPAECKGAKSADWLGQLKSPDTERWACKTTAAAVQATIDVIPAGWLREWTTTHHAGYFALDS